MMMFFKGVDAIAAVLAEIDRSIQVFRIVAFE